MCPPLYTHCSASGLRSHSHVNSCGCVCMGKSRAGPAPAPDFVPELPGEGCCFLVKLVAVEASQGYV